MPDKKIKKRTGFTLMEVLVSLFVVMNLTLGIYGLIILVLNITIDNKNHVEAIEIANQKMEQIRNMPYQDVGVISGIPNGIIPQEETITRDGVFIVNNYVSYFDDPADGQAGSSTPDTIPNDYKIASVKVSWQGKNGVKSLTIFSKIIPRTVEMDEGYGLLKIVVSDASAQPLANASVRIVNNLVNPPIDVVNLTNGQGVLYLPATSSYQGYEITVTKTDEEPIYYYGIDQTYGTSTGKSPLHMTVTKGNMTEEAFTIDRLATLEIRTVRTGLPDNWPINENAGDRQHFSPRFSVDGADNLYFVWQSWTSTSSYVYAQKYNSAEIRQWASDHKIINTIGQTDPDIVTTASGNSFVVWQDNSSSLKLLTFGSHGNKFALNDKSANIEYPEKQAERIIKQASPKIENSYMLQPLAQIPILAEPPVNGWFDNLYPAPAALSTLIGNETFDIFLNKKLNALRVSGGIYKKLTIFNSTLSASDYLIRFKNNLSGLIEPFRIKPASAVGTIVQTKIGSAAGSSHTLTATFDDSLTDGNVIIAIAAHRNNNASFNTPSNAAGDFTESVYSNSSWYLDVGIWHKIAGAGEPQQVTLTCTGSIDGGVMMLMEVSGLDTSDLVDEVAENDQTGSDSFSATTGLTPATESNGFAVAAVAFADNNFNTPNSSNWSSASADSWTHRLWHDWSTSNNGSLAAAAMNVTVAAQQSATLTLTGSDDEERNSVMAVFRLFNPDDVAVSAIGTQIGSAIQASSSVHIGGTFVITDLTGARDVTGITIVENGTIDAQADLDNIRLYYKIDNSAPYDCDGEDYSGSSPYGSPDSDGFSGADGISTFSDSVGISTAETMCVYAVFDIGVGASKDETIEISINYPESDVVLSSGNVVAGAAIELAGTTYITIPAELNQERYRWRDNDGGEDGASWKESENTETTVTREAPVRLRFKISNRGSLDSSAAEYRIEYGEKLTTCAAASWTAIPITDTLDWQMAASADYDDGDPTTEQLFNPAGWDFIAGEIKEDNNQTGAVILGGDEATEIEYAIMATDNASDNPYCFRVTNAGAAINNYDIYPEISIIGDKNIYIISLDAFGNELWAVKRVNSDASSADQTYPRIALSENYGTATSVVVWQDERGGNWDIYAQSFDENGNKLWNGGGDEQITGSSTSEHSPVVAIDSMDNVFIAWVEDSPGNQVIYSQKYDLNNASHWPHARPLMNSAFDVSEPSLALDASNNLYLTYTETVAGIKNVYLAKYDTGLNKIWDERANLEEETANQSEPDLALNNTYVYVSWVDNRDNNYDIYAQKYDLNGLVQWSVDMRLNVDIGSSTEGKASLLINSSNDPYAVWSDGRDINYNIYATKFSDPGAINPVPNIPLALHGSKTICETPIIYECNRVLTTDGNGIAAIQVEWDIPGYEAEITSTSPAVIELMDPAQPLPLMPYADQVWYLYIE